MCSDIKVPIEVWQSEERRRKERKEKSILGRISGRSIAQKNQQYVIGFSSWQFRCVSGSSSMLSVHSATFADDRLNHATFGSRPLSQLFHEHASRLSSRRSSPSGQGAVEHSSIGDARRFTPLGSSLKTRGG